MEAHIQKSVHIVSVYSLNNYASVNTSMQPPTQITHTISSTSEAPDALLPFTMNFPFLHNLEFSYGRLPWFGPCSLNKEMFYVKFSYSDLKNKSSHFF